MNYMASELEKQITTLEQLSAVQQRFVSDVSHEPRTPLTTVRMAAEVLYEAREDFMNSCACSVQPDQLLRLVGIEANAENMELFSANPPQPGLVLASQAFVFLNQAELKTVTDTCSGLEFTTYRLSNGRRRASTAPVALLQLSLRGDVLIDPEEVLRVDLCLDRLQARVVVPIGGLHPVGSFVHHEVHVRPAGRIGMQRIPVVAGIADMAGHAGRIVVRHENDVDELRIAMAVCGIRGFDILDRAVQ